jgi:serine/threonine-protein kinase
MTADLPSPSSQSYAIVRELGRGGMATVYLARDLAHDRLVALKVLRSELGGLMGVERFGREIAIASRLRHPHILPIYQSGALPTTDGTTTLYYAMPYVAGPSLRQRLVAVRQLPVAEAVSIARQVAVALDHAHHQGVIHRDIKPENILLAKPLPGQAAEAHALVADFGIARALDAAGGRRLTETGLALGTPAYMSPEQGMGATGLDGRADIYALGCVLYEMLAGQPPFTGPTAQAVLARHAVDPVPSLRTIRPDVPAGLAHVIKRALAKVPADRFSTAQALADALADPDGFSATDLPAGAPTAEGETAEERNGETMGLGRRTTRGVLVAIVLGIAGATAIALAVWRSYTRRPAAPNPATLAVAPFRVAAADPSLGYLSEGIVDLLSAKLGAVSRLRVADPASAVSAWRRVVESKGEESASDAPLRLARTLGVERVIDGSLVGTPDHVTLTATLLRYPEGRHVAEASIEGPVDSVSDLLDHLVVRLMTIESGVDVSRLSVISSSLPATRAFLVGRAAFRKGQFGEAANRFREAMDLDSTFALAAFELVHVAQWGGAPDLERAIRLVQAGRERLSPGDRVLLDAFPGVGPYPTGPEYLQRWEAAANAYPDRAEVWYWLGDAYYHNARMVGFANWLDLADRAFRRGWALDSANVSGSPGQAGSPLFAEPLDHMVSIATMKGDTASVRRWVRLGVSADSTAWFLRWHGALALGDSARRAFWADSLRIDPGVFGLISQFIGLFGYGSEDLALATRLDTRNVEGGRRGVIASSHGLSLQNGGRPREARRVLETDSVSTDALAGRLLNALYWEGDTSGTTKAAQRLASRATGDFSQGEAARDRRQAGCISALWRAVHADYTGVEAAAARLRAAAATGLGSSGGVPSVHYATLCAALLDAMWATAFHLPDAKSKLAEADQAARTYILIPELGANLLVARVAEAQGDLSLALKALRRRAGDTGGFAWYLSTFLREEGRLAEPTGDTTGAIKAYQHFLTLRPNPEPELKLEVEQVRQDLAGLMEERRP